MESFDGGGKTKATGDGLLVGDAAGFGDVGVEREGGHAGHNGVFKAGAEGPTLFFNHFGAAFGDTVQEFGGVDTGSGDGAAFFQPGKRIGDGDHGATIGPEGGIGFEEVGSLEDVDVGVGLAVEKAIPEGVEDI